MPTTIATLTGDDGFAICYVSFASVVAADGALVATPTVETTATSSLTISDVAITFAGTVNGVSYSAGEMLTFTVTKLADGSGVAPIDVIFETAARKETLRLLVRLALWEE